MSMMRGITSWLGEFLVFLGILGIMGGSGGLVAGFGAFAIVFSEASALLPGQKPPKLPDDVPAQFVKNFLYPGLWMLFFILTGSWFMLAIAIPTTIKAFSKGAVMLVISSPSFSAV